MNGMKNTSPNAFDNERKDKESDIQSNIGITEMSAEQQKILDAIHDVSKVEIPSFPIAAFPPAIQNIIKATNESLSFPVDFMGASILYAASLAIGNTHRVQVRTEWTESALLFIANVGKPNTNKSHPLTFALRPLTNKDKESYKEYREAKKVYDELVSLSKKEREEQGEKDAVKPILKKLLVSDFTPEALIRIHQFNKRGIGLNVDELATWYKNFNRYHKGSEQEFWLSVWSHAQISVDRISAEPVLISKPFIGVAGNIQPQILLELAKGNRGVNGYMDRILYAFPYNLKKPYWNASQISPSIFMSWDKIISNLLKLELGLDKDTLDPQPKILKFSAVAEDLYVQWFNKNAELCRVTKNETLAGIHGKFDIHVARLSLILTLLRCACDGTIPNEVSSEGVTGALLLAEYFRACAIKVQSTITSVNPLDKLPANKRELYEKLPDTFTSAEGLEVAASQNFPADTFNKWLRTGMNTFFAKLKIGEYKKLINENGNRGNSGNEQ